jgi:hypothetical protein
MVQLNLNQLNGSVGTFVTRKRDGKKIEWLLSEIPADANHELGFKDLLARTRLGPKSTRIGSPSTLQSILRRLIEDGYIEKKPGDQIGRGHKAGYYRTAKGTNQLTGEPAKSFPHYAELDMLRSDRFNVFPDIDGHVFVYSQSPISDFDQNALEGLSFWTPDIIVKLEEALAKKHPVLRVNPSFGDKESRFKLLERRYEISGRVRSNLPASQQRAINREAKKHGVAPDKLTYDMVGKRLDHIPLSNAEYQEYLKMQRDRRKISEAWKIAEQPLAVLVCNPEFTHQLVLRGKLIVNQDGSYENVDDFVQKLDAQKLLDCEVEFWQATRKPETGLTPKYAKTLSIQVQDEKGEFLGGYRIGGPRGFGLQYPPHILRTSRHRHLYFEKIHVALTKEIKRRGLKEKEHDSKASIEDLVEAESERFGCAPTEREIEGGTLNLTYRIRRLVKGLAED